MILLVIMVPAENIMTVLVILRTLSKMMTHILFVAGTVQTKMNDDEKCDDNCGDHYEDTNGDGCVDKNSISDGEV